MISDLYTWPVNIYGKKPGKSRVRATTPTPTAVLSPAEVPAAGARQREQHAQGEQARGRAREADAAVGVAIDALIHHKRQIYQRGDQVRTTISPAIGPASFGASVSVVW